MLILHKSILMESKYKMFLFSIKNTQLKRVLIALIYVISFHSFIIPSEFRRNQNIFLAKKFLRYWLEICNMIFQYINSVPTLLLICQSYVIFCKNSWNTAIITERHTSNAIITKQQKSHWACHKFLTRDTCYKYFILPTELQRNKTKKLWNLP